jgi:L-talarate/galactarate dehydratase
MPGTMSATPTSPTGSTPNATAERLTSVTEHMALIDAGYLGIVQPDAPRIGGITPLLRFVTLASHARLALAPRYAMEIPTYTSRRPTRPSRGWSTSSAQPNVRGAHRDP